MVPVCYRYLVPVVAALLLLKSTPITAITTAPQPSNSLPATCDFRTINYITDTLPQLCGKSSWSSTNITAATKSYVVENPSTTSDGIVTGTATPSSPDPPHDNVPVPTGTEPIHQTVSSSAESASSSLVSTDIPEADSSELNEASFLSFEEWKEQTLKKAGQNNPHIGSKRPGEKQRDSESVAHSLESFGDEGEIDLGFAFTGNDKDTPRSAENKEQDLKTDIQDQGESAGRKDQYRSRDAGKTCKERFNYASFDAGATVLKTHHGAKNSKAILVENKDTYMLSKCATANKFLIVELSEDIWIDTLVLASYEFFSSMIRTFRVSVSDKYPVKMEKWKDLGTYEARNSREIQAFLIENPQIWARYIRIEFLTHYGNEFYCPLSLVRVHGTRMLESWKEAESIGDGEEGEEGEESPEERLIPDAIAEPVKEEERLRAELKEAQAIIHEILKTAEVTAENSSHLSPEELFEQRSVSNATSRWASPHVAEMFPSASGAAVPDTCAMSDYLATKSDSPLTSMITISSSTAEPTDMPTTAPNPPGTGTPVAPMVPSTVHTKDASTSEHVSPATASPSHSSQISSDMREFISSITSRLQNSTTTHKSKTSTTASASSALPTIQESFFKAVSRRLQLLETNSTLSLKYIEEQSRILREAFSKVEKKQLQKTTTFLDTLNNTVLAELRTFRQQYDEIWQSTVISLEGQREESRREILAISARLNILADEVVFQKRMSIIQSVLLLLCLGLVIFSRVSGSHIDIPLLHSRARALGLPLSPLESPPESPEFRRSSSMTDRDQWLEPEPDLIRKRRRSDSGSSQGPDNAPPTPISTYSRSDNAPTPPSGSDDLTKSTGNILSETSEHLVLPSEARVVNSSSVSWNGRTPKKRKSVLQQQESPPPSSVDDIDLVDNSLDDSDTDGSHWAAKEHAPGMSTFLSPPAEDKRLVFDNVRKPLPALPPHDGI